MAKIIIVAFSIALCGGMCAWGKDEKSPPGGSIQATASSNARAMDIMREAQKRFLAAKTYRIIYRKQGGKMIGGGSASFDLSLKRNGKSGVSFSQTAKMGPLEMRQIANHGKFYQLKPGDENEAVRMKFAEDGNSDVIAQYFTDAGTVEKMTETEVAYRIRYRFSDADRKQMAASMKTLTGMELPPNLQPAIGEYVFSRPDIQPKEISFLNATGQLVEKAFIDKLELDAPVDETKFNLPKGCSVKEAATFMEYMLIQQAWFSGLKR